MLPGAEADIASACARYDEQSRELGDRFLDAVLSTIELVSEYPHGFAVVHQDVRRALTKSFPFGVFYTVRSEEIVILGCFHASRSPRVWKARFSK